MLIAIDYGFIDGDGVSERECFPFLSIMDRIGKHRRLRGSPKGP